MAKSYYKIDRNQQGLLEISDYVFSQIAEETRDELLSGELKEVLSDHSGKSKAKITSVIDARNHVSIDVEVYGYKGSNLADGVKRLQEEVYNRAYELTEIRSIKVSVSLVGVLPKEK